MRNDEAGRHTENRLRDEGIAADRIALDMAAPGSIAAAAEAVRDPAGQLDVLINNAAVHYDRFQRVGAPDFAIVEEAWQVNTLGPWRMALAVLDLLRAAPSPRIVNVSSESAALASMTGTTPAYSLSKIGLNALTLMMARKWKADGQFLPRWRTD